MTPEQFQWRYAVKRFDPTKTIPAETWKKIEECMVLTPSSFGLQPWKFLVIESPEVKAKLPDISWNQSQPGDCSHFVAFAALHSVNDDYVDRFIKSVADKRNSSVETFQGYRNMILGFLEKKSGQHLAWASNQVYIALGQLLSVAASLSIDACPMEGLQTTEYDKLLGLEGTEYQVVVGCALGYRHPEDKYAVAPKVRFPMNDVLQRF
jgi:nitroreductase